MFSTFSSNPNPVAPQNGNDYLADYEEEAPTEEEKPSFPMLAMTLPPPTPTRLLLSFSVHLPTHFLASKNKYFPHSLVKRT